MKARRRYWITGISILAIAGFAGVRVLKSDELTVEHAECSSFGDLRNAAAAASTLDLVAAADAARGYSLSGLTMEVTQRLAAGGQRQRSFAATDAPMGLIDSYIYADLQTQGIQAADKTTDWEFIRRVTLDLTGRIPAPDKVLAFVADAATDKRAKLIDSLVGKPEWVDKWTMYLGDQYKNTVSLPSSGIIRFADGRNAFFNWMRGSLADNKPYNDMVTELITASGGNSYDTGPINWLVGGIVSMGPAQDIVDQQAANVATTFLGISQMNCLLCHNGRGHLDQVSLWAKNTTRAQAWQFASNLSHVTQTRGYPDRANFPNTYYWSQYDDQPVKTDYALGSTTGNRPSRTPPSGCAPAGKTCYIAPVYIFNGHTPNKGENYRVFLAREVTGDFQFARATVNYIWKEMMGRGLVEPVDGFDPARQDPDNPPPEGWSLQASNARLLNALAQKFIESRFSLRWLMREIAYSDAYQMSSAYPGKWLPSYEPYFARHYVRRLMAEEVHDAVLVSAGILVSYDSAGLNHGINYAMQFPDVVGMPTGRIQTGQTNPTTLLDSFLRGNRDDSARRGEGSVMQALNLMNDPFIVNKIRSTGSSMPQLMKDNLGKPNDQFVNGVYLAILSRYPTDAELQTAVEYLQSGDRNAKAEDVVWSLYNKVDFVFNY